MRFRSKDFNRERKIQSDRSVQLQAINPNPYVEKITNYNIVDLHNKLTERLGNIKGKHVRVQVNEMIILLNFLGKEIEDALENGCEEDELIIRLSRELNS